METFTALYEQESLVKQLENRLRDLTQELEELRSCSQSDEAERLRQHQALQRLDQDNEDLAEKLEAAKRTVATLETCIQNNIASAASNPLSENGHSVLPPRITGKITMMSTYLTKFQNADLIEIELSRESESCESLVCAAAKQLAM